MKVAVGYHFRLLLLGYEHCLFYHPFIRDTAAAPFLLVLQRHEIWARSLNRCHTYICLTYIRNLVRSRIPKLNQVIPIFRRLSGRANASSLFVERRKSPAVQNIFRKIASCRVPWNPFGWNAMRCTCRAQGAQSNDRHRITSSEHRGRQARSETDRSPAAPAAAV